MHERQAAAVAWLRRKCIAGSYRGAAHRAPAIGCTGCQWAAPAIEAHRPTGHGHWLPASRTRRLERSLRSVWASGATGYRKRPTGQAAAHRLPASNRLHRPSKGCAPATAASIEAHRPTEGLRTAPAASIEGGCTATAASGLRTGCANGQPRGAAHRTGHRLHRLPASKAAARPRLASNRTRTEGLHRTGHGCQWLHRPTTGRQHRRRLHRPTGHGHWSPASKAAAPANRPRPLAASIAHKASRTLSEKRLG